MVGDSEPEAIGRYGRVAADIDQDARVHGTNVS
jgi:hypothetical protein